MQSQNRNSNLGACSQVAVFVFDYIPCVRSYRTHSTAVKEINVERPLRHIYELGAWLVAVEASTRTNSRSGRGSSGSSVLWKVCKKGKLITQNSNTAWKMPFEIQAVIFEQNSGKYFFFYCFGILFRVTGGIFLKEYAERGQ